MADNNISENIVLMESNFEVSALKTLLLSQANLIHAALDQYEMSAAELEIVRDAYKQLYRVRSLLGIQ